METPRCRRCMELIKPGEQLMYDSIGLLHVKCDKPSQEVARETAWNTWNSTGPALISKADWSWSNFKVGWDAAIAWVSPRLDDTVAEEASTDPQDKE